MERKREIPAMIREYGPRVLAEKYRQEIEKAIDNAKRTAWDKKFRRAWYRAGAIRKKKTKMAWPRRWKRERHWPARR